MTLTFEKLSHVPENLEDIFTDCSIYDRYFAGSSSLSRSLQQAAESQELYVARNECGQIVSALRLAIRGFCGLYPYIKLFGVHPAFRSQGVGRQMLDYIEKVAKESGARRITLMVSDFNTQAQAVYRKRGYTLLGTIPDAVKPGIAELLMIKDLL